MRKRVLDRKEEEIRAPEGSWLDLEQLAEAEITSESTSHPFEAALRTETSLGWRAADPGEQVLRLFFDRPLELWRIRLVFQEEEHERSQEFVLRWSPDKGKNWKEIVRQQFNFNPSSATREIEEYQVALKGVTAVELKIVPDRGLGLARASLMRWLMAGQAEDFLSA